MFLPMILYKRVMALDPPDFVRRDIYRDLMDRGFSFYPNSTQEVMSMKSTISEWVKRD